MKSMGSGAAGRLQSAATVADGGRSQSAATVAERMRGARVTQMARCACGLKFRRWRFVDGEFAFEALESCHCGKALVWVEQAPVAVRRAAASEGAELVCKHCDEPFRVERRSQGVTLYCSDVCRVEVRRIIQRDARRAKSAAAGTQRVCPKCERILPGRTIGPLCTRCRAEAPAAVRVSGRSLLPASYGTLPKMEFREDAPKSTNHLDTAEAEAAARANPRNKRCEKCRKKFYDGSNNLGRRFCGLDGCSRDQERGEGFRPLLGDCDGMLRRRGVRGE